MKCASKKIHFRLIEDNCLLRERIARTIQRFKDKKIVAASGTGENGILKIRDLKPHAILLHLGLRSQCSLDAVEIVKNELRMLKLSSGTGRRYYISFHPDG